MKVEKGLNYFEFAFLFFFFLSFFFLFSFSANLFYKNVHGIGVRSVWVNCIPVDLIIYITIAVWWSFEFKDRGNEIKRNETSTMHRYHHFMVCKFQFIIDFKRTMKYTNKHIWRWNNTKTNKVLFFPSAT